VQGWERKHVPSKNTTRFKQIEYLCVERTLALISQVMNNSKAGDWYQTNPTPIRDYQIMVNDFLPSPQQSFVSLLRA